MQDIKKKCDGCPTRETLKKTMDNPSPESEIKTIKIPGRGKSLSVISLDLCKDCHATLFSLITHWIGKTKSLTEFFPKQEDPSK